MKRPYLFILLLSMVMGLAAARPLHEGNDYKKLSKPFPSAHPDKIEVVEVFAYNCFHCQHFEPLVEDFAKKTRSKSGSIKENTCVLGTGFHESSTT